MGPSNLPAPSTWLVIAQWLSAAGIGAVLVAIVGQFVPWRKQASDERAADFQRVRDDAREARADAKEARAAADKAGAAVQRLENMLACLRPAISILMEEVRRLDPDADHNAALRQVRELMTMAAAGDFGVMPALAGLAAVKGAGE